MIRSIEAVVFMMCTAAFYVRGKYGKRDELAVRVLYCRNCKQHHRELPDFVVPHKHFDAEVFAAVCDARQKTLFYKAKYNEITCNLN